MVIRRRSPTAKSPPRSRRWLVRVARLGEAMTGGCPFRASHFVGGRVPRALPWADEWKPFGLEPCADGWESFGLEFWADGLKPFGLRSATHSTQMVHPAWHNNHRALCLPRQRRSDSIAQGNALGTRANQSILALKGRDSAYTRPSTPPARLCWRFDGHFRCSNPTHIARHTPPCIAPGTS